MAKKLTGTFATRREAEIAVEHLVQSHSIERTDIFIETASSENSAGVSASGGDAESADPQVKSDQNPALNGEIVVSVDINGDIEDDVRASLEEAGATSVDAD